MAHNIPVISDTGQLGHPAPPPPIILDENREILDDDKGNASALKRDYTTFSRDGGAEDVDATGMVNAETYKNQAFRRDHLEAQLDRRMDGIHEPQAHGAMMGGMVPIHEQLQGVETTARMDERLRGTEETIKGMQEEIARATKQVDNLNVKVGELLLELFASRMKARQRKNILRFPINSKLLQVPFPDGTEPWGQERQIIVQDQNVSVQLPALDSVDAIRDLAQPGNIDILNAYVEGYYGDDWNVAQPTEKKIKWLLAVVGCKD
ncbi:hypothetical protein E1B28_005411 [Marasmius oreades]|uniref:Mug135-like C-terminal domain-containing protein n=1 Tax=Marasmius oreades TaxID=181124 RepID=A0A9P7S3S5_9AGAR|nr:uncharacterized protein E1B28_005411 [Marasmius oreades]KAG7094585.1 hypothetical protein E1B28_005411 [Marasmius oreades]